MNGYSEDDLVEQPAIELFAELGYETANCFHEVFGAKGTLGREHKGEVVLVRRLRGALERLNPGMAREAIAGAIEEIRKDRSALNPVHANHEVFRLLKDGVPVAYRDDVGEERVETVRVIDWMESGRNDFFLASQFWVAGELYTKRPDLVGFVNGLPLVLFELKAAQESVKDAYDDNLTDYKATIPQLFWFNALIVLSNGSETRIGTITSGWEHFAEWKKIDEAGTRGVVSLETAIRGTCEPGRLLDIVENFTLFTDVSGRPVKLVAKNHQYLGVNAAFARMRALSPGGQGETVSPFGRGEGAGPSPTTTGGRGGRLGVFWHTQGSGKSYSMVFFSQKVLRTLPGDWTFLIVTDRIELDEQIYGTFAAAGAVTEDEVRAESGEDLQRLLRENHRNIFTLIQKFRNEPGQAYPVLSERSDIVVITDEAHRSQYDQLAMNMRRALPNAAFIAFTGTPLIVGEEKTREVFGDYVSIYNFRDSIEDGATVPLYYENRVPEVQLTNPNLNADIEALIAAADLDEEQERRLEREFAREYHLITREERLDRIARDIVAHYLGRYDALGESVGKAMVVSIDKATTVRMYEKVRKYWDEAIEGLRGEVEDGYRPLADARLRRAGGHMGPPLPELVPVRSAHTDELGIGSSVPTRIGPPLRMVAEGEPRDELITRKIAFMETANMAVVVSPGQNEQAEFAKKGLDITPHRARMVKERLDDKFKDPDDPFRMVFVTAMWMTGFDVPSLEVIYLDRPLRNHSLMQTIARANRVFEGKTNGLIVDYVGIFRDLERALAIYGSASEGGVGPGELPVRPKDELIGKLREELARADGFCRERGVEPDAIVTAQGFERVRLLTDAADALMVNDETKKHYLALANAVALLYRAILPDPLAQDFNARQALHAALAKKIRSYAPEVDIGAVMAEVENLLDASIATQGYVIHDVAEAPLVDLSQVDFEALRAAFERGREHVEVAKLRGGIERTLRRLVELNRTRMDYLERFQRLIEEYNAGAKNIQLLFDDLVALAQDLNEETKRAVAEQLTEEELALFDLLTRPGPNLSAAEEARVKAVTRELLGSLKANALVIDWRKKQQARARVEVAIRRALRGGLRDMYSSHEIEQKSDVIYQHVYESYYGAGRSLYGATDEGLAYA